LEGKEIQSKTSGELSREIAKSYLLFEYMNPKIVGRISESVIRHLRMALVRNGGLRLPPSLFELQRTPKLILLSQKVARFEFENQLFEKIQGLAGRC
jgi:hypothetical protein